MSDWRALTTPQKATLETLSTLSWFVSYRRLSSQFQFSLSLVTLEYLSQWCSLQTLYCILYIHRQLNPVCYELSDIAQVLPLSNKLVLERNYKWPSRHNFFIIYFHPTHTLHLHFPFTYTGRQLICFSLLYTSTAAQPDLLPRRGIGVH